MLVREERDRLILLSAISPAWIFDKSEIIVKNAPTYFGKVSLKSYFSLMLVPKETKAERAGNRDGDSRLGEDSNDEDAKVDGRQDNYDGTNNETGKKYNMKVLFKNN